MGVRSSCRNRERSTFSIFCRFGVFGVPAIIGLGEEVSVQTPLVLLHDGYMWPPVMYDCVQACGLKSKKIAHEVDQATDHHALAGRGPRIFWILPSSRSSSIGLVS